MSKRALIAMSGGVDSSVAALLMKEAGYDCAGATMKLFDSSAIPGNFPDSNDASDARSVASRLGIDFKILDFSEKFKNKVIDEFIAAYERGETPNPCVNCNINLKFGLLLDTAVDMGFDRLATGHYARTEIDTISGRMLLKKAKNPKKDQSYVLYGLSQDKLKRAAFPLGSLSKDETRQIAEENGFKTAHKAESQDICFVKGIDYSEFIERYTKKAYPPGDFLDTEGNVIGRHKGIIRYTIGQRKGLGVSLGRPAFVVSKDPLRNSVTLASNDDLFSKMLTAHNINLIPFDRIDSPLKLKVRTRYNQLEEDATVTQTGPDELVVEFASPQRAFAPGQSVVLYDGDYIVGGGIIS